MPFFFAGLFATVSVEVALRPHGTPLPVLPLVGVHLGCAGLLWFGDARCRSRGRFLDMERHVWLAGCAVAYVVGVALALLIHFRIVK